MCYDCGTNSFCNAQSTFVLDSKGANTPMSPIGPYSEHIYHHCTIYEGWISSKFTPIHKSILVIMQGWYIKYGIRRIRRSSVLCLDL